VSRPDRYVAAPRLSWEPPLFVVIDGETGVVLSTHATESDAVATAEGMNLKRR
jgi:hypothetical protein